jgi:hypothetical protein
LRQQCQAAIADDPMNFWLWDYLCTLAISTGEAIAECELGVKIHPQSPSHLMVLSNLYAANGQYTEAIKVGAQFLEFKPAMLWLAVECECPMAGNDTRVELEP